jgi:phospholipase/carboxylesterase
MVERVLGGVKVRLTGGVHGEGGGDGPLVVLLHGFGAPGDDLVPLAEALDVPEGTRWLFPEGLLSLNMGFGDSRAWWLIDMARFQADRATGRIRDLSSEIPQGLALARERLLRFLAALPHQLPVDYRHTIIGGFSQGAMLACDVVLHSEYPFAGLVQLSGNLLAESIWLPLMPRRKGLSVYQSHGTLDDILPYVGAERLRDAFERAGLAVDWYGFRGGHEIPESVLESLGGFLRRRLVNA